MTVKEQKKALRAELMAWREHLTPAFRQEASRKLLARLYAEPAFQQAKVVFAYASMAEEVQLDDLLKTCLTQGKRVCIPDIVSKGVMVAVELHDMADLETGKFGIRSLHSDVVSVVSPEDIDLVIVPGAAFTPAGARLGLGGGYYDRYLPKLTQARRVALIFDGQVVDDVPVEEHDQFVDELVTEQRSIVCQH
jgi:5-formyltetrahydrofolate cyclo-ligase